MFGEITVLSFSFFLRVPARAAGGRKRSVGGGGGVKVRERQGKERVAVLGRKEALWCGLCANGLFDYLTSYCRGTVRCCSEQMARLRWSCVRLDSLRRVLNGTGPRCSRGTRGAALVFQRGHIILATLIRPWLPHALRMKAAANHSIKRAHDAFCCVWLAQQPSTQLVCNQVVVTLNVHTHTPHVQYTTWL